MIKKIIILGLILAAGLFFYKKFLASTLDPFFRKNKGNVDILQLKTSDYEIK
jgi:hypothetical protein